MGYKHNYSALKYWHNFWQCGDSSSESPPTNIITLSEQHFHPGGCWNYHENYYEQIPSNSTCLHTEKLFNQLILLDELLETVQIILAITLAAYCCKVIPCCSPRSNVPVIVMTPPAASE
ncbi:uncharacterized protein si:ch211-212k18.9 isoform X6 [Danio rerio]|uniref:Uncharacterized protein si:ch211-212k18.9 isoform X6 n=1 Tax=Danio rerio TaxID=7955 RepID=A0AC58G3T1_DANRE|nr:uncharacterized protein si:ch211-212k18.9 isoform X3 [Danio rerio]XP_021333423.1 uncharacterized protein si:ch211-212k18.9 isoform X3 [Danio rerio]|eukprot:XP_021327545.1 uncharacterized protein si:ch211-212k18.9 isoform X3 [Danio rerio]